MTTFADLPETDVAHLRRRLSSTPRPRRAAFRVASGATLGFALGGLGLVNRLADKAHAAYFLDYTDETSGPCDSYASNHTEQGLKCGPSTPCNDYSCCWQYRHGAGNEVGWHRSAPSPTGYFLHRPDQCWSGTYDAWQWKFSDGHVYRCSDGYTCDNAGHCFNSICPWAVT